MPIMLSQVIVPSHGLGEVEAAGQPPLAAGLSPSVSPHRCSMIGAAQHGCSRRVPRAIPHPLGHAKDTQLCANKKNLHRSPFLLLLRPGLVSTSFLASHAFFSLSPLSSSALLHFWSYFENNQDQILFKRVSQSPPQRTHRSDCDLFINLLKRMYRISGLPWALARPFVKKCLCTSSLLLRLNNFHCWSNNEKLC